MIRTVFDELLDAVGDVKVAVLVYVEDVARFEPAVLGEGVFLKIWAVPVAAEDVGTLDQELAGLDEQVC